MDRSDATGPTWTRRGFLGGAAGLAAAAGLPGMPSPAASVTVLTRNAYLGVGLSKLLEASGPDELRDVASEFRDQADPELYAARADAIAGEVEETGADVVALQEVGTARAERRGPGDSQSTDSAASVDLLDRIGTALDDRGLDHEVAATTVTTELDLTAMAEGQPVDVRIADRDALLVRGDLGVDAAASHIFDATERVKLLGGLRTVTLRRGFCTADVTVDGGSFTAVSTHLEALSRETRRKQAGELLERLPTDRPVVLAGDFNSGPGAGTATYDRLTRTFDDAYAVRRPDADGFTCCQASDLRNERSTLDRRVDAVLYRGDVRPTGVERVGHRPEDRVAATVDGDRVRVWPSDHAGVAATVRIAGSTPAPTTSADATPAPTTRPVESERTPASSGSPTDRDAAGTRSGSGPGLGALAALAGIGAGVAAGLRRR